MCIELRQCNKCDYNMPVTFFMVDKRKPLGYGYQCRQCKRDKDKERSKRKDVRQRNKVACRKYQDKLREKRIEETNPSSSVYIWKCKECNTLSSSRKPIDSFSKSLCKKCNKRKPVLGKTWSVKEKEVECKSCGCKHISKYQGNLCQNCKNDRRREQSRLNRIKYGKGSHKKRAEKYGGYYEPINRIKIYERDKYKCYLCGTKVVISKEYQDNQASIDHVVPMSKGGSHSYANIKTCCMLCNSLKSDSIDGVQATIFTTPGYSK